MSSRYSFAAPRRLGLHGFRGMLGPSRLDDLPDQTGLEKRPLELAGEDASKEGDEDTV